MAAPAQQQQSRGESNHQQSSTLSDLVKDMVKEMDADEFYSTTTDLYDESAEVQSRLMVNLFRICLFVCITC